MLLCSFTKKKTGSVFPPSVTPLSDHASITCCDISEVGYCFKMYHDRDTFDFSQGHLIKNQPMAVPV